LVRVETDDGIIGWGEAHHGRCPGAVSKFVDTTMSELAVGMDAFDVTGVWARVYRMQLASHGLGAAAAMGLSGLDLALWDIRAKVAGWPLYRLLGGRSKPIKAYAGGIALGWQEPPQLVEEARKLVEQGYRALKLRLGDTPERDLARVRAVRAGLGPEIDILTDANTNYTLSDVRKVMGGLEECSVGWLEEPFPPHERQSYRAAAKLGRVALAAGENHFTRFEFQTLAEDGDVTIWQPDLSKCGGLTEGMRIAAMSSARGISINPHTSATAINMAVTAHFLCAVDNPGYFEADVTAFNPFRDELNNSPPYALDADGCVLPLENSGIGIDPDEAFLARFPLIDGPCYV
jgi:D-galactarolactone cycloisomerase